MGDMKYKGCWLEPELKILKKLVANYFFTVAKKTAQRQIEPEGDDFYKDAVWRTWHQHSFK